MPLTWLVMDHKSRFRDMNATTGKIFGRPVSYFIGKTPDQINGFNPELLTFSRQENALTREFELAHHDHNHFYDLNLTLLKNKSGQFSGRLIVFRYITAKKLAERERERPFGELQESLKHTKNLQGLLPICAHCKKMRDDEGYWHQVESYVSSHSEATFTHGICPSCMAELYSEVYLTPDKTKNSEK